MKSESIVFYTYMYVFIKSAVRYSGAGSKLKVVREGGALTSPTTNDENRIDQLFYGWTCSGFGEWLIYRHRLHNAVLHTGYHRNSLCLIRIAFLKLLKLVDLLYIFYQEKYWICMVIFHTWIQYVKIAVY